MNTQNHPPNPPKNTSSAPISIIEKIRELGSLFLMRVSGIFKPGPSKGLLANAAEYEGALKQYAGIELACSRALEIGFGARPLQLFTLAALGVDVIGSDLDAPVLHCTPRELYRIYRHNGLERAAKTAIRFMLTDLVERREVDRALRERGARLKIEAERLRVGDAAELTIPQHSLDFIYSEAVFEHIPRETLQRLVAQMALWIKPSGLALIRPHIYTGITGGHLAEWFGHTIKDVDRLRKSEPWEHLRKQRYQPNTYLNQLTRADYRQIFSAHFDIIDERESPPGLGSEYLTPQIADELSHYSEEDLLSNAVLFVLRPRTANAMTAAITE